MEMRRELGPMPLGISILPNGTESALSVAHAVYAAFVRIKVYVGAVVAFGGVIEGTAYEAQSFRTRTGAQDIQIAADVYDRSSSPLGSMPIEEAAIQASRHGMADALVVTGTSVEESLARVRLVKPRVGNTPVYVGGGTTHENVARFLAEFDGVIVGHTFKRDKESGGGVDVAQVRQYMEAVKRVRT
jgi:membrane complex biogenesis BtpA family protein